MRSIFQILNQYFKISRGLDLRLIPLVLISLLFTLESYSQDSKITLKLNNVSIEEVLDSIELKTNYKFFVDTKEVELNKVVSIDIERQKVSVLLQQLFPNNLVYFEIYGDQIILKKNTQVPQYEISGTVTNFNRDPIKGVNVQIDGVYTNVNTDFDGRYTLMVSSKSILIFSFFGMKAQRIHVENKKTINVELFEYGNELSEIVVVGYGSKKKINLSGAVVTVEGEEFESRGVTTIGQALQGTIANLNIVSSASPNTIPSFNIRGVTSLAGGEPLVIIDGITATQQDLARMNANDIASISILKDAASASIYGSRAAFGVILVNTKIGNSDKMKISVSANSRFQTLGRTPELELNPFITMSFQNKMAKPWYNLFNPEQLEYARQVSLGIEDPTRISPINPNAYENYHSFNWRDEVLNDVSYSTSANLIISQKLDKGNYYFSVEGQKNSGIYKYNNDVQKRLNIRLKSEYDLTDWLSFKNNTWIYNNEYDEANVTGSSYMRNVISTWTTTPAYNEDGSYTSEGADLIGRLLGSNYTTSALNAQTSFSLTAKFLDDRLTIVGDATYKKLFTDRQAYDGPVTYSNGPGHIAITGPSEAWAYFRNWKEENNTYNVYASFSDIYNEMHNLTLLAGYNQEEYFYNHTRGDRSGLLSTSLPTVELATGNQTVENQSSSWATQGMFARINYIYNDKYILELNGRYDGSSRYYKDDRWVFNPSASASWIVSKENFLNDSFFDLLKFRISYGSLGNQNADTYATYPFLGFGDADSLLGEKNIVAVSSPGLIAPSFTWETIQTKNIGIDVVFLNARLVSSFDYYHRKTLDMFAPGIELPAILGTDVPDENATDLISKGWEFSLNWRDKFELSGKSFNYNISFNLGDNRAYITKYPNPLKNLNNWRTGQEVGEIWGFVSDGYFESQEDIDFSADQTDVSSYPSTRPLEPGDIKFKDLDGNGRIDFGDNTEDNPGDQIIIGNTRSRFNYGLILNSDWNGFDLRIFLQGVGKKDFYPSGNASRYYFWSAYAFPWSAVTKANIEDHWTPTNRDAFYPRPKSYVAEGAGRPGGGAAEVSLPQTRWLQDASYVRLKNVTIGYTLPKYVAKDLAEVRLYVTGENLLEFTNLFEYLDPENLEGDGYPFRRTYSLGLSLRF